MKSTEISFMFTSDAIEHENCRGMKLLYQIVKMARSVFESMIREGVNTDVMQFGFVHVKGTNYVIFVVRVTYQFQRTPILAQKHHFILFSEVLCFQNSVTTSPS